MSGIFKARGVICLRIGWTVVLAVTATGSASCGDEPLPEPSSILSEASLFRSNGESLSTCQVSSDLTSLRALTTIREFPNLETKFDGVVFNGTVDDFARYRISDRTVTPDHSVN